ncbi:MAG: DUF5336 domain-containing protein [Gordonia sp. (in: high G+C Gram-positive bacteria)]|uniref:DUF5336 domain-containing protein n=1 Tax=Gordonia sp. (in: high G+C Gram-positive bacteria) TaxID=84139 RepID=UPI0039E53E2C
MTDHPGQQFPPPPGARPGPPHEPGRWGPVPPSVQQTGPMPPTAGPYGPPRLTPARPNLLASLPLPIKLAVGSSIPGLVAFVMGFVSWVTVDSSIEQRLDNWANQNPGDLGVPAFLTTVFTPGYFLLGLGAAAIAALGFVAVKWRRYLPHIAFLVTVCWLGLIAAALALPPVVDLGAGAIVALIFGAMQFALIAVAVVMDGLAERP